MVIKTEVCAFSDTRIYPGHGVRFIRRDGQVTQTIASSPNQSHPRALQFLVSLVAKQQQGSRSRGSRLASLSVRLSPDVWHQYVGGALLAGGSAVHSCNTLPPSSHPTRFLAHPPSPGTGLFLGGRSDPSCVAAVSAGRPRVSLLPTVTPFIFDAQRCYRCLCLCSCVFFLPWNVGVAC